MRPPFLSAFAVLLACARPAALARSGSRAGSSSRSDEAAGSSVEPTPADFALTHVTVVNPERGDEDPDRTIVVREGRIERVVPSDRFQAASARRILEERGRYVIPGLWDMHVHFLEPRSAKLFVANGVTAVRVMWGNPPMPTFLGYGPRFHDDWRADFESGRAPGPRMVIASALLDGPHPIWPNAVALSTADEGRSAVDRARAEGADFIKVYSLLPRDVYFAIADESGKQGIPFVGHVPFSVTAAEASDAGQKSIEHLTGVPVACSRAEASLQRRQVAFATHTHTPAEWSAFRRAESAEALATYDAHRAAALFATFAANGTWHCPTLTALHALAHADESSLRSDPQARYVSALQRIMWARRPDTTEEDRATQRSAFERGLAMVGAMNVAHVLLLAGTDESNPFVFAGFGLHDELEFLVKAGLRPVEALRAATSAPARFFGWSDRMGSVTDGKAADLVVLEADPLADIARTREIVAVVARGVVYTRPELDRMLEQATPP
jgi:imidazolonepropionase-like amidohydrolase